MFWDGVFHLYAWLATVVAVTIVAKEAPRAEAHVRTRALTGGAFAGWGLFNLVEGLIDHHLVGLHHVHPGAGQLSWDIGFLVFGGLLTVGGAGVAVPVLRRGRAAQRSERQAQLS